MQYQLSIAGLHYELLRDHLFSGDGKESVAIALCGRSKHERVEKLLVHDVLLIPNEECFVREADIINWPTERILPLLEKAAKRNFAILKIHSHPTAYPNFSKTDDKSDIDLFSSVFGWTDSNDVHCSAIMLPNGEIFGRVFDHNLQTYPLFKVQVVSDEITIWESSDKKRYQIGDEFARRMIQAFGDGTYAKLKKLKIGVVGCSGTGSVTIEQLIRLGVGELVLIDPDTIEEKNLNRILNSTYDDLGKNKVNVISDFIAKSGFKTKVTYYASNLFDDMNCLKDLCSCDLIFGCVDSIDGRDLLNLVSTYYIIPFIDMGVKLEAGDQGDIKKIVGSVNYIKPGFSSLKSRQMYDSEDLKAAGLLRTNPEQFEELVKNSYIKNLQVSRPAVISVNMQISSHAINEFLNRIHPFKGDSLNNYAQSTIDITEAFIMNSSENDFEADSYLRKKVGRGDCIPFLELIGLQNKKYE